MNEATAPHASSSSAGWGPSPPDVALIVCIPTFRRAGQLRALLEALIAQQIDSPFAVLVGNNDPHDGATTTVLAAYASRGIEVLDVLEKGVVAVRNALIARAIANPAVRWVACLDDDQLPAARWLAELVAVGERHRADLVGGPVVQKPGVQTFWAAGATDTSYLPEREGRATMLNEGGNLLLAARFLRGFRPLPFDPRFAHSGGEDYEFFRQAVRCGALLVWAPDARVEEVIPAARLSFRGLVWRSYSTAASQVRADRAYDNALTVGVSIVSSLCRLPVVFVRSLLKDRSWRRATSLLVRGVAAVAGRVSGLSGAQPKRYGVES